MPTPDEIVKAAEEQEAEAKRLAEHQVQDLRQLNKDVDPDAEAESAVVNKDPVVAKQEADAPDLSGLSKAELVEQAEKQGIDPSGTAAELRKRLAS